jgi:alkylation response protein AidB-like acyl-CoA dehydrogenase
VTVGEGTLMDVSSFKNKVGELEAELMALEFTELRTLASVAEGGDPGPESSILKLKGTEIQQRISQLNLEASGIYAAPWGSPAVGHEFARGATSGYLSARATTIYGGASEVQKDVISKNVLDLGSS